MRRWGIILVGLAVLALGATEAYAYLSAGGSGSGRASVTALSAPTLGAPAVSDGATPLSWTDAKLNTTTNAGITYIVQRRAGSGDPWTTIGSGPCQSTPTPLPSTTTSCTDTATSSAHLTYRVVAQLRSWTATGNEAAVDVRVLDHFVLSAPASSVAGATVPLRITAVDAAGQTIVNYTGTVTLASSDPAATLPARVTFTAADAGSHVVDSGVQLRTAGQRTLSARDTGNSAISGTATVSVTPAAATQLVFTQQPSSPTPAGTAFTAQPVVALQDAYGNAVTAGAPATVTLALTSPQGATLSCGSVATNGGVATFTGCAISAPGTYALTASSSGLAGAQSTSVTIVKRSQTVVFTSNAPTGARVGGATYAVSATATSGLPVTFSLASGSTGCTVSGATVTFTAVGTCRLQADQAGNAVYEAAPSAQQSFAVGKGGQTIAFTSTAPTAARVAGATYTVSATATSGLPVTFSVASDSTGCTVSGATVTFTAVGTCRLQADQAGNANYDVAPSVQQAFTVAKGNQTITFASAPSSAAAGGTATVTATATSGLPVTYASATTGVCTVNGATGVATFVNAGTCTITADQPGNANYNAASQVQQAFTVAKGNQTIGFTSTPPNPGAVNGTYAPTATASSGLPVTLTVATASASICRINATTGAVTLLAVGTCTLNANQAGNANYNAAPLTQQSFVVGAGLRITSADAAGGGRYTFTGANARSVLSGGTITITVCTVSIIPCPSANVVDTNANGFVLLSGTFTTGTPTGVLPSGTYYAQAAQTSAGTFSPPFPFTVP